jgi:hypothetical protein
VGPPAQGRIQGKSTKKESLEVTSYRNKKRSYKM